MIPVYKWTTLLTVLTRNTNIKLVPRLCELKNYSATSPTPESGNKDVLFSIVKSCLWFNTTIAMLSYSPYPGPQISRSLQRKQWDLWKRNLCIIQAIGHGQHWPSNEHSKLKPVAHLPVLTCRVWLLEYSAGYETDKRQVHLPFTAEPLDSLSQVQ
jgi:hypothetical protein